MNRRRLAVVLVLAIGFIGCLVGVQRVSAGQATLVPNAEQVRFQLIGNEPIASPDGRSLVKGWSVLLFKHRAGGACYVAFTRGSAITAAEAASCPP